MYISSLDHGCIRESRNVTVLHTHSGVTVLWHLPLNVYYTICAVLSAMLDEFLVLSLNSKRILILFLSMCMHVCV